MADHSHIDQLRRGREHWNSWRANNPGVEPDLSGTTMKAATGPHITGSGKVKNWPASWLVVPENDFRQFDFSRCNLSKCNAVGECFSHASFRESDLSKCNFSFANLEHADFAGAIMLKSNISFAKCAGADFTGVEFQICCVNSCGADLASASGAGGATIQKSGCLIALLATLTASISLLAVIALAPFGR